MDTKQTGFVCCLDELYELATLRYRLLCIGRELTNTAERDAIAYAIRCNRRESQVLVSAL